MQLWKRLIVPRDKLQKELTLRDLEVINFFTLEGKNQ
jgi:hypothetical protein